MVEQFSARNLILSSDIKDVFPTEKIGLSTKRGLSNDQPLRSVSPSEQKTFGKNMLYENAPLKRLSSNWLRASKARKLLSIEKRNESGLQRLQYELSNLKSRLFDHLQEYEDLKDSFPDKDFPSDWEPQAIQNLRDKVDRLNAKIEKKKNKHKMKADDREVARMVESLLGDFANETSSDDRSDSLKNVFKNEMVNDGSHERRKIINGTKLIKKIDLVGKKRPVAVPESLKTKQKKLFLAGKSPPRTWSERDSSEAALHCALSRLPPLKKRVKARKFRIVSSDEDKNHKKENIVHIPNKLRIANGRAFVHERQKEFVTFHKKRLHEMDVRFTRTAFECIDHI